MTKYIVLFLVLLLYLSSCKKKQTTVDQVALDQQTIATYLTSHSLKAQTMANGINYIITSQGIGNAPVSSSNVTVNYKGYLTDDATVFAQSPASGNTFNMSLLIAGLQQTIPLLKKGGKLTVLIPSALGYGIESVGVIPANSVLVFDLALLDFN